MRSMEQVRNNGVLELMQLVTAHQTGQKAEGTEESDFHRLMEQTQGKRPAAPEKVEEKKPAEAPEEESPELEEQMVLAAMVALQRPVVPLQQTLTPTVEQTPVDVAQVVTVAEGEMPGEQPVLARNGTVPGETLQLEQAPQTEGMEAPVVQTRPAGEQAEQPRQELNAEMPKEEPRVQVVSRQGQGEQESGQPELQEAPVFQQVESTPVKVGEAPRPESSAPVPVEEQVSSQVREAIQSGETRVELQLDPANLGKVQVELTVREDGGLHISLKAENSVTRTLLERDVSTLQTLLGRDSGQEVRVEIEVPQGQPREELYDQQKQGGQQQQRQQQEQEQPREDGQDFLHQLRLGLIPGEGLN